MARRWLSVVGACGIAAAMVAAVSAQSAAKGRTGPNGLSYSTASNAAVQHQRAADSCHARGRGIYSLPDRRCTPGALNPAVTQSTIGQTICRSGWTASVRPPESITEREKYASMAAYGDSGSASGFEYDHFVPLELGGATNDARNLWPEPGGTPNLKDTVEDYLNQQVCDRRLTLARAQKLIVTDWVAIYRAIKRTSTVGPTKPSTARCSARAAWNGSYDDYDVYINSNQPDTDATVTGDGMTASYYTNSSGYADVYFHASASAAGDRVTVRVGSASCHATL